MKNLLAFTIFGLLLVTPGLRAQLLPDLAVTRTTLSQTHNLLPGQLVNVDYDVQNVGPWGTAQAWGDRVLFNTSPSVAGAQTLNQPCRFFPNFVLPGQTYSQFGANPTLTVAVPAGLSGGVYYIGYECNFTHSQAGPCTGGPWFFGESTYSNNEAWVAITVDGAPSFVIQGLALNHAVARPGDSVVCTYSVSNVGGSVNNGSISGAAFLSATPTVSGAALGSSSWVTVASGASVTQSITLQIPTQTPVGHYYLVVNCAYYGGVPQGNTAGNVAAVPIAIGASAGAAPFGSGCGGPAEPVLSAIGEPQLAAQFTLRIGNMRSPLAILFLGGSRTSAPDIGQLPVALDGIGMPGCFARVSPDTSELLLSGNGHADWTRTVPNDTGLVGAELFAQGLVMAPGANAAGLLATGGMVLTVGF